MGSAIAVRLISFSTVSNCNAALIDSPLKFAGFAVSGEEGIANVGVGVVLQRR